MVTENLLLVAICVGAIAYGLWTFRKNLRVVRRDQAVRRRAREVSATIVKVDYAVESRKALPTFQFRTFEGQDVTARSKVNFDGKKELELLRVGASMPVLYDPQDASWVAPTMAKTSQMYRKALSDPLLLVLVMGASATVLLFVD